MLNDIEFRQIVTSLNLIVSHRNRKQFIGKVIDRDISLDEVFKVLRDYVELDSLKNSKDSK